MEAYPSTESTHDEPPPRQPGRVEPLRGQEAPKRAPTKGIVAFLVLAFGAAWGIWVPFWLLDVSEESRLFALVYVTLFAPALAAIVVRRWLADSGDLYVQATTMTFAGIVMGQVGAGLAMRTTRESVFSVGPLSNRFLL